MGDVGIRFYSWLKQGFARDAAGAADTRGLPQAANATLSVATKLTESQTIIRHDFALAGPGDIATLDAAAVSSVNPQPASRDCPPNFFPYAEFNDASLPWQYTPAMADAPDKPLAPWLVLVVVEEGEGIRLQPAGNRPNFCLSIADKAGDILPDPLDAYNWAHVEERGDARIARLIAPVRMAAGRSYLACLVPMFEAAKRAGLGRAVDDGGALPAWDKTTGALDLPVYHHWRFRTGQADFETLARRLVPRQAGESAGLHDLDLSVSGGGLNVEHVVEGAKPGREILVSFAGGLTGPEVALKKWPQKHKQPYQEKLVRLLAERASDEPPVSGKYDALKDDPVVGPPVYGHWQAQPRAVENTRQHWEEKGAPRNGWFDDVNTEPALRAAAGLGAQIVVANQEEFVAKAWTQLAGVRDVQVVLRNARMAMSASSALHGKIAALDAPQALQLTQGVHDLVKIDAKGSAVIAQKTSENASADVLSPAFARLSVAAMAKARRVGTSRANDPQVKATKLADAAVKLALTGGIEASQAGQLSPMAGLPKAPTSGGEQEGGGLREGIGSKKPHKAKAKNSSTTKGAGAIGANRVFKGVGTVSKAEFWPMEKTPPKEPAVGNPEAIRKQAVAELNPAKTVPELVNQRIEGLPPKAAQPSRIVRDFSFPLEFDEATYRRLQKLDPEFLMPGFSAIPEDTVTIVEANPAFIEAFLIGMNHEMSREFAWRQMPLLLNGNWFRKFWNYRGAQPRFDLDPVAGWPTNRPLGGQSKASENAVLLIKSELFRQYPRTRVVAVKAGWGKPAANGELADATKAPAEQAKVRVPMIEDSSKWETPIFDGRIGKSAQFFGFDLTAEQLVGRGEDAGYFLMLEQGARDIQFGLDPADGFGRPKPAKADNLHWGHFVDSAETLEGTSYAPADAPWGMQKIEGARWGGNSAETARLCLQRKVRMLFPARSLIDADNLTQGG